MNNRLSALFCSAWTAALLAAPCAAGGECSPRAKALVVKAFDAETHGAERPAVLDGYSMAIAADPACAIAYSSRGGAYISVDTDKALADLSKAIELDPSDLAAYYNRSNIYFEKGLLKQALADINASLPLETDLSSQRSAYYRRGKVLARMGKHQAAIADYTRVIRLGPDMVEASTATLAAAPPAELRPANVSLQSRGDGAVILPPALVKNGAAVSPEAPETPEAPPLDIYTGWAFLARGLSGLSLKRYDKAAADFTVLIEHDRHDAGAYYNRAIAWRAMGLYDKASADEASFKASGGKWVLP